MSGFIVFSNIDMKIKIKYAALILRAVIFHAGCSRDEMDLPAGYKVTVSAGGVRFVMAYVPGGMTFPTGTGDTGTATVANAYWISETEVTYELWYKVRTWAVAHGYTFANPGREGNDGTDGAPLTNAMHEPVTYVNWRDSMVWCNALTEWHNAQEGTDFECVYYTDSNYTTPHRSSADGSFGASINPDAGGFDAPYVKTDATGYRLLTNSEWELAARYRDGKTWTPGNWASGGTGPNTWAPSADYPNFSPFAWYGNSTSSPVGNTDSTKDVRGRAANALGLYDMSGNVYEWCFEWHTSLATRVLRGGSWTDDPTSAQVGFEAGNIPYQAVNNRGFRFARTH